MYDGHRYQERGNTMDSITEFIRLDFKEYKKVFDIASIKMMNPPDSMFKNDNRAMTISELNKSMDSLRKVCVDYTKTIDGDFNLQMHYFKLSDSVWNRSKSLPPSLTLKKFSDIIPDSSGLQVNRGATNIISNLKSIMMFSGSDLEAKRGEIRLSNIEWHRKFSLSLACMVLFFIGAPLGSIIRKGGLGMPLVIAIIFFLMFHLLNMFGEKFARGVILPPSIGMWLPVIVLTPVGFFLTYKALHDSQLFNQEYYYRFFKKIGKLVVSLQGKKKGISSITQ